MWTPESTEAASSSAKPAKAGAEGAGLSDMDEQLARELLGSDDDVS